MQVILLLLAGLLVIDIILYVIVKLPRREVKWYHYLPLGHTIFVIKKIFNQYG